MVYPTVFGEKFCRIQPYVKKEIKSPMKLIYRNEEVALC